MSLLAQLLRPFWLSGLHQVTGHQARGLGAWIAAEHYQVYQPLATDKAILSYVEPSELVACFAADSSRMATASIETIEGIGPSLTLPKSLGWLVIRCYYAAFFAAHSILRMLGRSCIQLDATQLTSIHDIADAYGQRAGVTLTKGLYLCACEVSSKRVELIKLNPADGSHGAAWTEFHTLLGELSTSLLGGGGPPVTIQAVSSKLIELRTALTDGGNYGRGTWLSYVRNRTNYQLSYGLWYPYTERATYYDTLFGLSRRWIEDPLKLPIWNQKGRELQRFVEVCVLIVALCRAMSEDMAQRCPKGKPFHSFGCLSVINRMAG